MPDDGDDQQTSSANPGGQFAPEGSPRNGAAEGQPRTPEEGRGKRSVPPRTDLADAPAIPAEDLLRGRHPNAR